MSFQMYVPTRILFGKGQLEGCLLYTSLSLREPGEEYTEITKRLSELEIPVKMEQGYMNVINGHWKAVSYTHLDVYKRQVQRRRAEQYRAASGAAADLQYEKCGAEQS